MQSNPYKPPRAPLVESSSAAGGGKALSIGLAAIGVAAIAYWGYHFLWHLQYWGLYVQQASSNPLLGPLPRAGVDLSAVAAGALMIRKSRWLFIPFSVHLIAYASMILSITGSYIWWSVLPVEMRLTFISHLVSAAVVLLWYAKVRAR